MNFQRGRENDVPEINLIPLIDVLLVIIIFLMLTTTYAKFSGLEINLPTADASKQAEQPNEVAVAVTAAGQVLVNKVPLVGADVKAISEALRRAAGDATDPVIVINADAKATHQSVVDIMQAAQTAGYPHISFATQSPTGSNPMQLAHGISVALYNTGFGLVIAIPGMIFWRHFRALVNSFVLEMQQQAVRLVEVLHGERKV